MQSPLPTEPPSWMTVSELLVGRAERRVVNVDANAATRAWLELLRTNYRETHARHADPAAGGGPAPAWLDPSMPEMPLDQYWLEVAYQCVKLDVQAVMRDFNIEIHLRDPEKEFALAKYPEGRGLEKADRGREARDHYRTIRGFILA